MFTVFIKWNREHFYSKYIQEPYLAVAITKARELLESGNGERVKSAKVVEYETGRVKWQDGELIKDECRTADGRFRPCSAVQPLINWHPIATDAGLMVVKFQHLSPYASVIKEKLCIKGSPQTPPIPVRCCPMCGTDLSQQLADMVQESAL